MEEAIVVQRLRELVRVDCHGKERICLGGILPCGSGHYPVEQAVGRFSGRHGAQVWRTAPIAAGSAPPLAEGEASRESSSAFIPTRRSTATRSPPATHQPASFPRSCDRAPGLSSGTDPPRPFAAPTGLPQEVQNRVPAATWVPHPRQSRALSEAPQEAQNRP